MCGIVGTFDFQGFAPADRSVVQRMAHLLAHRGPDAEGFYFDGPLGVGHRRLAILDLSERGRQPMVTASGRYVIVFNGEIYNYLELRAELEACGYRFRTDTDTEVLLALYETEGAACLQRLNGMFAFAVWDVESRRLFIARDRVGIKPLYYTVTPKVFAFASEVKALFACPSVSRETATESIDTYMTLGYVPGEDCLFKGIRKLQPGHYLTVDPAGGVKTAPYWDVTYAPNTSRSADETADELSQLLLDAVRIHLRSDVPVGVFLSGGLDSSAMVSLLAETGVRGMKTFSVAYNEGDGYDETKYARLVARHYGTSHHELYVDSSQFLDFIPDYVWWMDEPVTEAAALSLYFISRLLRKHVTVALSGEGSDELFAGYQIYGYMQWLERYRSLPAALREGFIEPLLTRLPGTKVTKYLKLSKRPLEDRYLGVSLHETSYKDELYTNGFRRAVDEEGTPGPLRDFYSRTTGRDAMTRMLYTDLKAWLVDDLLIKADKMTMANSIELRVPFLDYRVVEYAATIPSNMKLRRGQVKWILKRAMKDRLPREVLQRKKMGFPTPLAIMFRRDLSEYLRDVLLSDRSVNRGFFRRERLSGLIDEHTRGTADHHQLLWKLIVLEEWHRQFMDGDPLAGDNRRQGERGQRMASDDRAAEPSVGHPRLVGSALS